MSQRTNQRRHLRVRGGQVAAHVRIGEQGTACMIENISQGGLFLRTERGLPVGSAIVISLVKPGMKVSLQLTGKVASLVTKEQAAEQHQAPGMGVAFDPVPEVAAKRLAELLKQLGMPDEYGAPVQAHVAPAEDSELTRLRMQLSGLMMQLGDMQQVLLERERELPLAKEELEKTQDALRASQDRAKALAAGSDGVRDVVKAAREQLQRLEKALV